MKIIKVVRKADVLDDAAKIIQRILWGSEPSKDVNSYMEARKILNGIRFWDRDAKSKLRKARLLLLSTQYDVEKEQVKKKIDPLFRELINKANEI